MYDITIVDFGLSAKVGDPNSLKQKYNNLKYRNKYFKEGDTWSPKYELYGLGKSLKFLIKTIKK